MSNVLASPALTFYQDIIRNDVILLFKNGPNINHWSCSMATEKATPFWDISGLISFHLKLLNLLYETRHIFIILSYNTIKLIWALIKTRIFIITPFQTSQSLKFQYISGLHLSPKMAWTFVREQALHEWHSPEWLVTNVSHLGNRGGIENRDA